MSKIYEGDDWKKADADSLAAAGTIVMQRRTRAQQQSWMDIEYGEGRITLAQWRHHFDFIGSLRADGSFRTQPNR